LAGALPGLRRVDLEVNYRCPAPVVAAAVRLVEQNAERFAKRVRPRPDASGRLILAPAPTARDPAAEMEIAARAIDGWPADDGTRAILARTRRELLPAAALALERGIPFRADGVTLLLEDPRLDGILAEAAAVPGTIPLLLCLGAVATAAARRGSAPPGGSPVASEPAERPPTDAADLDHLDRRCRR
jgi:superfamily I DNA/RNA helicase